MGCSKHEGAVKPVGERSLQQAASTPADDSGAHQLQQTHANKEANLTTNLTSI
jgi:hypothetical protein